ncbi:MAG: hypothetical protein RL414_878 [Actinomycetota bacterium]
MADVSKSRKILLVTNDLGPHAGGIESFILGLLGELDGSQIVIYTSSQDGDSEFDRSLSDAHGVVVIRDRAKVLLPTPRVNRSVAHVMREYGCEYIWFGAAAPLGWMSGFLKRRGAKRVVALSHGHEVWWAKVFPFSLLMRAIGRSMDAMGYLGKFTHDAMAPALGKKIEMVRIAPGISTDHFIPGEKSSTLMKEYALLGKDVIVCVGRLVHRKGQDRLIEAMPEILTSRPNAVLVLVGEGPYKSKLVKLVHSLGIEESVRFIGRVQYSALPAHIQLGDLFAMPSRSRFFGLEVEGLGIVYLEASSCGVPVIAGASGGAPDAVLEGETGVVVNGSDVHAIADAVVNLLNKPELRRQMSERGREWASQEWNWVLWGQRFEKMLLGLN